MSHIPLRSNPPYHEPLLNRYMTFMYLQIKVYKCNQGWGQPFLSYPSLVSHPEFMYVHCEKKRVSLTKLWSSQLQPSSHLHLVIKECAHKCNQYFDPISSPDLKKGKHNKIYVSHLQEARRGRNAIACSCRSAAVEVQL